MREKELVMKISEFIANWVVNRESSLRERIRTAEEMLRDIESKHISCYPCPIKLWLDAEERGLSWKIKR